ncbi:N-acetylglutamate synthase [hydrothermal vent metagenome]|uniref:amino-acid N-acetyltransferase n=1 Tax=hydrothermal vent metagenome TaxID=652676 RepID=A0A3B0YDC9_9ZZZZ
MKLTQNNTDFINGFRASSPYIHAHRGSTFVLLIPGKLIKDSLFSHIIHDIALLTSLGIRLVLVHGARTQIDNNLDKANVKTSYHQGLRITDDQVLSSVKDAVGHIRVEFEALLSQGLINTPMSGASIRVSSGNYVVAKPLGIVDGIDFRHTGQVRRVDLKGIHSRLDGGDVVLLSPIGYSPSGDIFNLDAEALACNVACELQAEKLLLLVDQQHLSNNPHQQLLRELTVAQGQEILGQNYLNDNAAKHLRTAIRACESGVLRSHLINAEQDGALLLELFSRDGCGTLVTSKSYDHLRPALAEDASGILELISPLIASGALLERSRESLEIEISDYYVLERDGMIIGCAALHQFGIKKEAAELACLAVHPQYCRQGHGNSLLNHIKNIAKNIGIKKIFALTTLSEHWFIEQGFIETDIETLPIEKKQFYNLQRKSKIFCKHIV